MIIFYTKDAYAIRVLFSLVIPYLVVTATCGCADHKATLSQKNENGVLSNGTLQCHGDVVDFIRSVVVKQVKALSNEEKTVIQNSAPDFARYRMGYPLWEYYWFWKLPRACPNHSWRLKRLLQRVSLRYPFFFVNSRVFTS